MGTGGQAGNRLTAVVSKRSQTVACEIHRSGTASRRLDMDEAWHGREARQSESGLSTSPKS